MSSTLAAHPELSARLRLAVDRQELTIGSICSGLGVAEKVINSLNDFFDVRSREARFA